MTSGSILIQFLNGLASASSLFLVAAGLSLIFGVTRIVNFAHGSLYMVAAYLTYTLIERLPAAREGVEEGRSVRTGGAQEVAPAQLGGGPFHRGERGPPAEEDAPRMNPLADLGEGDAI